MKMCPNLEKIYENYVILDKFCLELLFEYSFFRNIKFEMSRLPHILTRWTQIGSINSHDTFLIMNNP